jgi:hypothetical protein
MQVMDRNQYSMDFSVFTEQLCEILNYYTEYHQEITELHGENTSLNLQYKRKSILYI